jgi:hypothetical protein
MTWKVTNRLRMQQRWHRMLDRCYNPDYHGYPSYGARGIRVCPDWLIFDRFYAAVGDPPGPNMTLDRIDNDKGYQPGNVRWATKSEQARNQRPRKRREYDELWDYRKYLDCNAIAH